MVHKSTWKERRQEHKENNKREEREWNALNSKQIAEMKLYMDSKEGRWSTPWTKSRVELERKQRAERNEMEQWNKQVDKAIQTEHESEFAASPVPKTLGAIGQEALNGIIWGAHFVADGAKAAKPLAKWVTDSVVIPVVTAAAIGAYQFYDTTTTIVGKIADTAIDTVKSAADAVFDFVFGK